MNSVQTELDVARVLFELQKNFNPLDSAKNIKNIQNAFNDKASPSDIQYIYDVLETEHYKEIRHKMIMSKVTETYLKSLRGEI